MLVPGSVKECGIPANVSGSDARHDRGLLEVPRRLHRQPDRHQDAGSRHRPDPDAPELPALEEGGDPAALQTESAETRSIAPSRTPTAPTAASLSMRSPISSIRSCGLIRRPGRGRQRTTERLSRRHGASDAPKPGRRNHHQINRSCLWLIKAACLWEPLLFRSLLPL